MTSTAPARPPTNTTGRQRARGAATLALLLVGLFAVVYLLLGGGSSTYTIHAHFIDAGQLVNGNLVEVGGRSVGKITDLRLTDNNQADAVIEISDDHVAPLHAGTVATIRQVGLIGIANRFIELLPGPPSAPKIPSGGVLTATQTKPIVDLDQLLDALDPPTRARLQSIFLNGGTAFSNPQQLNQGLAYLNPALSQVSGLVTEVASDRNALAQLLRSSGTVSHTVASRKTDLVGAIANTATVMRALASERQALGDSLSRAPGVLTQATGTLGRLRGALSAVNPLLRGLQPAAAPLARTLRLLPPVGRRVTPVIRQTRAQLPALLAAVRSLPPLAKVAVPAVDAAASTLTAGQPIFTGLRPYAPDLVSGLSIGFGGSTGGYYDANGHFARIALNGGQGGLPELNTLLGIPGIPGITSLRTGITARCPGAAIESAPDGSNPWTPDPSICDPAQNAVAP